MKAFCFCILFYIIVIFLIALVGASFRDDNGDQKSAHSSNLSTEEQSLNEESSYLTINSYPVTQINYYQAMDISYGFGMMHPTRTCLGYTRGQFCFWSFIGMCCVALLITAIWLVLKRDVHIHYPMSNLW